MKKYSEMTQEEKQAFKQGLNELLQQLDVDFQETVERLSK